jgi:hypothetical protein
MPAWRTRSKRRRALAHERCRPLLRSTALRILKSHCRPRLLRTASGESDARSFAHMTPWRQRSPLAGHWYRRRLYCLFSSGDCANLFKKCRYDVASAEQNQAAGARRGCVLLGCEGGLRSNACAIKISFERSSFDPEAASGCAFSLVRTAKVDDGFALAALCLTRDPNACWGCIAPGKVIADPVAMRFERLDELRDFVAGDEVAR